MISAVGTSAETSCSPCSPADVPTTRPRPGREVASTSPWYDEGTVTLSSEIGSSTTAPARPSASLKPRRCGVLERHVGRVDGVVLAVVALDPHVDDGEAVHAAGGHRLLDALLHRRDVVARDRAADDRVDELEARAAIAAG